MKKYSCMVLLMLLAACKKEDVPVIYYTNNNVVAHRGAWADYNNPQNSIASLKKAIEMNCAGSEFDVWLTKDDSLIVEHDPKYAGKNVESNTYAELSKTRLSNGEVLPTLRQYLYAGTGQHQTKLFLEIKSMTYRDDRIIKVTDKVIDLINEMQAQDYIVYTSFYFAALQRIKQRLPNAETLFLGGMYTPASIKSAGISGLAYDIDTFEVNKTWIPAAKTDSLILCAWIVNDNDQFNWLIANNFNYIITDKPNALFRVIDKMY